MQFDKKLFFQIPLTFQWKKTTLFEILHKKMKTWKKKKNDNENFHFLKKLNKIFEIHFTSIVRNICKHPQRGLWNDCFSELKKEKYFFLNCENCVFLVLFQKTWKKNEVGQLQKKNLCRKYLWVVSTFSKKIFFVEFVKGIKKFSWNNKKQHQKMLFFKSLFYPLLVCLFLLLLSHEVSRVQP